MAGLISSFSITVTMCSSIWYRLICCITKHKTRSVKEQENVKNEMETIVPMCERLDVREKLIIIKINLVTRLLLLFLWRTKGKFLNGKCYLDVHFKPYQHAENEELNICRSLRNVSTDIWTYHWIISIINYNFMICVCKFYFGDNWNINNRNLLTTA